MANSQVDINSASSVLKRIFGSKKAVLQFESAAPYVKSRKKVSQKFGAGLYDAIQHSDIQALGIRNSGAGIDNEDMPDPSSPDWDQPTFDAVRRYGRITLSGKAQSRAFSGDEEQSFMGNVADLTASITRAFYKDEEFSCFNTSTATGAKSGCRGVLDNTAYAAGAGVTFNLDIATNATTRRYQNLQGIVRGMNLDVYSSATWQKVASIYVTGINEVAQTFTGNLSDDLAGTATTWYLFRKGDFNREISGLGDIIDDGTYTTTYGGLTTATDWTGIVLANGGTLRDFSAALMNEAYLRLEKRNEGDEKMEGWMTYGMQKEVLAFYQRTLISTKQMGDAPFKVNLGGKATEWGPNFELKESPRMPSNCIYLVLPSAIDFLEQQPMGPVSLGMGKNGADRFFIRVPGKDNWEALLCHEFQHRTLTRNKMVKIDDMNQTGF